MKLFRSGFLITRRTAALHGYRVLSIFQSTEHNEQPGMCKFTLAPEQLDEHSFRLVLSQNK